MFKGKVVVYDISGVLCESYTWLLFGAVFSGAGHTL